MTKRAILRRFARLSPPARPRPTVFCACTGWPGMAIWRRFLAPSNINETGLMRLALWGFRHAPGSGIGSGSGMLRQQPVHGWI